MGVSKMEIFHPMQLADSINFYLSISILYVGSRRVAVHWLLDSIKQYNLLQLKSYLITVKPVVIEGRDVSNEFVNFEPLDELR